MMSRLYIIPCGGLLIDKGINLTPGYDLGTKIQIPVAAYLVDTEKKLILIDTGFNPLVFEDPVAAIGEYIHRNTPQVTPADHILSRLRQLNLEPKDIDLVVCTHLHFDHAGGNQFFRNCEIIVQKSEINCARSTSDYLHHDWDHVDLTYREIEGDWEIIPGVDLISTPGHSAGHQSILVRLPKTGSVLITGDAIAHSDQWNKGLPGLAVDQDLFAVSRLKLKQIAEAEQGFALFSHDPEQWSTLKYLPAYYE